MRVGVLSSGLEELNWVQAQGFRAIEWMRFADSPAAPPHADWKTFADKLANECQVRDIRISAIGALYKNPLDPKQSEGAAAIFRRAIEVAAHLGVRDVAGFAGAVIELEVDPRGGHPVYQPMENFLPRIKAFWEPLARFAQDKGVRLAFENCPQGPYYLPLMHYNILGQPAQWERFFNECPWENVGLEWDPSHLLCQFIDPLSNIQKFGSRIFHVHAKDAYINHSLLQTYGICHPGVAEHRFPGLGQANWPEIIHALLRVGYRSDISVEGWHDPVYRNHKSGLKLEDTGLQIARKLLEPLIAGTE
jgi:sugar phosphate isomerase/epimerase